MNYYRLINHSDRIVVQAEDDTIAGVAVMMLGAGNYGLERLDGEEVLPFLVDGDAWFSERGITNPQTYWRDHAAEIATVLESAFYGGASDLIAFDRALDNLPRANALRARARWNDTKRSSMNDIGAACLEIASKLREIAGRHG